MIIRIPIRRILTILIALIAVAAVVLTAFGVQAHITGGLEIRSEPVIIIDAGHGGFDGGAVAQDGTVEKELNLQIALKLQQHFHAAGFQTIMVRCEDCAYNTDGTSGIRATKVTDMKGRLALLNKYNNSVFLSIHLNKYSTQQPSGAQVFYAPNVPQAMPLAESIQSAIAGMVQPENHRQIKAGTKDTYLLYHAENPAVIVECGFLSNPTELELLKQDDYQNKLSFAIFCGFLNDYYGK